MRTKFVDGTQLYHEALELIDQVRAENTRLRAALEAAPDPDSMYYRSSIEEAVADYSDWYATIRAEALKTSESPKDAGDGRL